MTTLDKLRAVWALIEAHDEDENGEFYWLSYYRLLSAPTKTFR